MDELLKKYLDSERGPFHSEDWGRLILWRFDRAVKGARVYFTTRYGGVSARPYRSLNLGYHVGDEPERVGRNRELLGSNFDFSPERLTSPRQRHGAEVRELAREQDIGAGSGGGESPADRFDPCDGLVTSLRQAPLLLQFADCVPVVVTARAGGQPLLAVIHAGRAGLMLGVVAQGVERLRRLPAGAGGFDRISAAIGPSIGPCCYEVNTETAAAFAGRFGRKARTGNRLDLREAAWQELVGAGVDASNIHLLDICTACDESFYSYRRDGGVTGRQGALAWLE